MKPDLTRQGQKRAVENHSLGDASFGRKRARRSPFLHPEGVSPSEWFSTTRGLICGLAALLMLFVLLSPAHAQDRETVYRDALPLYQYDAHQALAVKTVETRTFADCRMLRFSYGSTHGQRVPALLFLPPKASPAQPVPCLVILHGLGGSKEMMAGLARFAAGAGYASLVIDEYGQGERVRDQTGTQAEQLARAVRQTVVDVRRGLDYLATRQDINSQKTGLVGVSLGAIIGTVTAGVEPRLKATALISGGGDWGLILKTLSARHATVGGRSTAGFQQADWAKLSAFLAPEDPLTFAPHIAPRALLLLHGRKDDTIVPQAAQELYDAAQQPKEIQWFAPYGHVPPPEVVYPALKAFFGQKL